MKIGERIKNLRELSNLTQEELAERAGLTKGFISQIERDLTSISLDSFIQILEAMDENISDFFRESSAEKIVYREIGPGRPSKRRRSRVSSCWSPAPRTGVWNPSSSPSGKVRSLPKRDLMKGRNSGLCFGGKSPFDLEKKRSNSRGENVSICRPKRSIGFRIRAPRKPSSSGSPLPPVFETRARGQSDVTRTGS